MNTAKLHAAIQTVAPIVSLRVGDKTNKNTWAIEFDPSATEAQRTAAAGVVAAFDPAAPLPREATANALIGALSDAEIALLQTGKPKDVLRFTTRGVDMVPETNGQVVRLSAKVGITPAAWFDRVTP